MALSNPAPIAADSPQPTPRGARWIGVQTAVERSGLSERQIRRLCGETWLAAGTARTIGAGRKPEWEILESADPRLSRVLFPDQMSFDLRTLAAEHRRALQERLSLYLDWRKEVETAPAGAAERKITHQFVRLARFGRAAAISRAKLFRMHAAYRARGVAGLIDKRWNGQRADSTAAEFLAEVERLYLDLNKPGMQLSYDQASVTARQRRWSVCSYATARRHLMKIPRSVLNNLRGGAKTFNDLSSPYIERDYSGLESNELWCGDHHQFDVIVNDGGKLVRPWLTAWQDVHPEKSSDGKSSGTIQTPTPFFRPSGMAYWPMAFQRASTSTTARITTATRSTAGRRRSDGG